MAGADGVEYPLRVTGGPEAIRAFGLIDQALAKNELSQEKYDALLEKSARRHIELIGKQSVDALVKQRLGIETNAKALKTTDVALESNKRKIIEFDAAAAQAFDRLTNNYTRRAAEAYVRNKNGLDDNVRSVNSLRSALDNVAVATQRQAVATQAAAAVGGQFSSNMTRLLPAFSGIGAALSRLDPAIGGFATAIGRANGAIASVTAGFGGPWGIAIGAGVAGLGLLTEWFRNTETAAEGSAKAIAEMVEQVNAADKAAKEANDANPYVAAQRADEARRKNEARVAAARLETNAAYRRASGDLTEDEAAARNEADRKQFKETLDAYGGGPSASRSGSDAARKDPNDPFLRNQRRDEVDAQLARLREMEARPSADQRYADDKAGRDEWSRKKAANDNVIAGFDSGNEARKREFEENKRLYEKDAESAKKSYAEIKQAGAEAFSIVGASAAKVFQGVAKGQKISGRAILSGIGDELIAKGTGWMFEGLFRLASSYGIDQSGTVMLGIGAGAVAFGMGLGAASRGGGGGKGGGSSRASSNPTIAPSRSTGSQYAQPLTVNVYALEPSAAVGERIYRSTRMAQDQGRIPRSAA